MKDFVSTRWIRVAALVTSIWLMWAIFGIHDFPWTGLVWASLSFLTALWAVRMRSNRSISQSVATPVPVAVPVPKAIR